MDLPHDGALFHRTSRPGQSDSDVSTLQAAAQRGADVVGTFSSIASRTLRYPVESLGTAAKIVLPGSIVGSTDKEAKREQVARLARRTRLLQQLSHANSWSEYSAACDALDQIEGAESWKQVDDSELYDVAALRHRLRRLRSASDRDDVQGMVHLVRCELTRDLGGICNPELHKQTRTGTKFLIDDYVATVREVLDRIVRACAESDARLDKVDVQIELEQTRRSYGRTALLLSGGGTLGMSHIGVVQALHEGDALPRIISGSSSGSIVASVLGCTPDDELLSRLHDFCHGDLAVFIGPHEKQGWSARKTHFGKTGHLFDLGNLRRVMVDLLGKTTFLEAYNRTRRVLNIAVTTSTNHESQQVLNYATAGNVVIWSAVVASCAVPFGFEPERLLYKSDSDPRNLVPWDPMTQYIDGSINGDLPASILSAEFDVNHSIVSQVNPHVAPFLKLGEHPNVVSRWTAAGASLLKLEAITRLQYFRDLSLLDQYNDILAKLDSVLTQRYYGDITLLPAGFFPPFWAILDNPTSRFMEQSRRQGEMATWPMLNMIKTHMDIELLIDDAVRRVSEHVAFSQSVSDLRKLHFNRSNNIAHASGGRLRSRRAPRHIRSTSGVGPGRYDQLRLNLRAGSHTANRVPGEDTPPSSVSSRGSSYDTSEDEDDRLILPRRKRSPRAAELTSALIGLAVQTQPNTPTLEGRPFFDSSRSGSPSRPNSPGAPPMSLRMTPVTPRSGSPEANYKTPPGSSLRLRATSKSPPRERSKSAKRRPGQSPSMSGSGITRSNSAKGRGRGSRPVSG